MEQGIRETAEIYNKQLNVQTKRDILLYKEEKN